MSKRDERYDSIISLFKDEKINTLTDIFKTVPRTVVAKDLGKKVGDLKKMLGKPDLFKLKELNTIAFFCGLTGDQVYNLVQEHEKLLKAGKITWDGKKLDKRNKR